ncbi:hypothetical protein ACIRD3_15665 [Kitasatospora sp. NPDC093550]|uniref:hypothetical protein n=1 Tax=Kitasatospora sp. NPDC093550 TaxID=3364089 RepID=UPI0038255DFC
MTADDAPKPCPMPSAHRRLMECHAQWHLLHEAYFDPHGFRLNLNALLQNLRNVTWLIQKQKSELPGFDDWYPRFTDSAGKDPLMRWSVRSRNRITKEADLELLSHMRIVWHQDWLQRVIGTSSEYPPRLSIREVVTDIMRRYRPPFGTMTVQRRWVDKELPDWELLDATGAVYSRLEALLAEGHSAAGVTLCDLESHIQECVTASLSRSGARALCMFTAKDDLEAHFDLVSGAEIEQLSSVFERDDELAAESAERYGGQLQLPLGDAIESVPGYLNVARTLMESDGDHGTFAFLFRGALRVGLTHLVFDSQSAKMLAFEKLASQAKARDADGVLVVSEAWFAVPTKREKDLGTFFFPARDRLDRRESLVVQAVTRDGRVASQACIVTREADGRTVCSEPSDVECDMPNTFMPIIRMWKELDSMGS